MMEFQLSAFPDIAPIQLSEDGEFNPDHWLGYDDLDLDLDLDQLGKPILTDKKHELVECDLHFESNNYDMPPMTRYIHGTDPFVSGLGLTPLRREEIHVESPHEPYSPELYPYLFPPSDIEYCSDGADSFSACHSDDLKQYSHDHTDSYMQTLETNLPSYTVENYDLFSTLLPDVPLGAVSCVALREVQPHYMDLGFDHVPSELDDDGESELDDDVVVTSQPQEGLQRFSGGEEERWSVSFIGAQPSSHHYKNEADVMDEDSDYRTRKASSSRGAPLGRSSNINGRNSSSHKKTRPGSVNKSKPRKPPNPAAMRPFPCALAGYGCHSTFNSKNEWKRHVSTQHMKLGLWRCDMCPPSADPIHPVHNDFNRKDLFTQHLRRMHTQHHLPVAASHAIVASTLSSLQTGNLSDEVISAHQQRCYRILRTPAPKSECLFCPRTFFGNGSWEERMEHVGAHFERERKNGRKLSAPDSWRHDSVLQQWLLAEGLIEHDVQAGWRIGNGIPLYRDIF